MNGVSDKTQFIDMQTAIVSLTRMARFNDFENRRAEHRYPFFQPVSISPDGESGRLYSAFSRDISESGISLLHCMPLEAGLIRLKIETEDGYTLIPAKLVYCQSAGNGWYVSGAEFIR